MKHKLIEYQLARAWSDTQMAEYLGTHVVTYRNWIKGIRSPPPMLARLVYVLAMVETLAPDIHAMLLPTTQRKRPGRKPKNREEQS